MGTSKGYLPPTGYLWTKAKRSVTDMVKNNFESESIGKAVGNYARASRGTSQGKISNLAKSGSKAVGFFGLAKTEGFNAALEKSGLSDLIGKDNLEVYSGLLDYFSGNGSTLDDSVIRDSIGEVMQEQLSNIEEGKSFEDMISDLDMNQFISDLITKFVQKDFLLNFAEKIEAKCGSIDKYKTAENQIKDFIQLSISSSYSAEELSSIDWFKQEGREFIDSRCNEVLRVFDVYLGD